MGLTINHFISALRMYGDIKDMGYNTKDQWYVIKNETFNILKKKLDPGIKETAFLRELEQKGDVKEHGYRDKPDDWFAIREEILQDLIFNATGRRDI